MDKLPKRNKRPITPRLPEETIWEFARLAKLMKCSVPVAMERAGHITGALMRRSVDSSLIDMGETRRREAYLEMKKKEK